MKVAEEYSAKSGEILGKKQVKNRYVNRVVKHASQTQSLDLGPNHQESTNKVNKGSRNPWCVPLWEDFLRFVCPECYLIEKNKETFIKHAFEFHPRASEVANHYEDEHEDDDMKMECQSPIVNAMDYLENVAIEINYPGNQSEPEVKLVENLGNVATEVEIKASENEVQSDQDKIADPDLFDNAIEQRKVDTNIKMEAEIISMGDNLKDKKLVEGANGFKCGLCQEELSSVRNLMEHMKSIHKKISNISKPNIKAKPSNPIVKSKPLENAMENPKVKYECTICDPKKLFCTLEKFQAHTKHWHSKSTTSYVRCKVCSKILKRTSIKTHMDTVHEGVRRFFCELCGNSYTSGPALRNHIKAQHEKKWEYKCSKCERSYNTKATLKQHFNAHHLKIFHQCTKCGKVFPYKTGLRKHDIVAHQKRKDYQCYHCGKEFYYVHSLNNHIKILHEGKIDPEAKCHICNKQFPRKSQIQRHIDIVHKKLRPYKCNDCDAAFDRKSYLRNHENKAHGKT